MCWSDCKKSFENIDQAKLNEKTAAVLVEISLHGFTEDMT